VLFAALITTISTTGYICLFILVIYYYLNEVKNKFLAYAVYLPIAICVIIFAYNRLNFMSSKIEEQTSSSLEMRGDFSNTRIGAFMFDMYYIKKHPFFGNGLHEQTRYADHPYLWGVTLGHGNAFSNYTAQMGIIALIIYFVMLYNAFDKKIIVPIIVALLFQGEQLMNYPLFSSLPFIILYIRNQRVRIN
jgi:O-antigen ligase